MMQTKKQVTILHSLVLLVCAALMTVAAFYDLQITKALGNPDNFFGILFVTLGEWPAYLIPPVCGVIMFYNRKNVPAKYSNLFAAFSALMVYLGFALWCLMGSRTGEDPKGLIGLTIVYSLIFTIIALWIGSLVNKDTMRLLFKWAVFAFTVLIVSLVISRALKFFWGRLRFRDMLALGDFSGFTPWYKPQGNTGNHSFPSGHATSAANLFVIVVLCDIFPKLKDKKTLLYVACTLFVVLVMISRLFNCAHFLSDVTMGATLSYFEFVAVRYFFFRNGKFTFDTSNG